MKNSSLETARMLIYEVISETNKIDEIDKLELLINLRQFLEPKEYRKNIKILSKEKHNGKNIKRRNGD